MLNGVNSRKSLVASDLYKINISIKSIALKKVAAPTFLLQVAIRN